MKKSVHQATVDISGSIDALKELRSILHETMESSFEGDVIAVRDRYDEVNSIVYNLEELRDYIENINLEF